MASRPPARLWDPDPMLYRHAIDTCMRAAIGAHGLDEEAFLETLEGTRPALAEIGRAYEEGTLPLLRLPEARDDLALLAPVAERYRRRFRVVVVLGTGGSSLGGQTLCALADSAYGPRANAPLVRFVENVDPESFAQLFDAVDPASCGFLVISKSGTTAETIAQFLVCLKRWREAVPGLRPGERFTAIAEPGDNPLRRLAGEFGIPLLDHDPNLGGRYAVLSLVGLLPAMIAGVDPLPVREGAFSVLRPLLRATDPATCEPARGAAVSVALLRRRGIAQTVLMPYLDRLSSFASWFRQLWAESLGKNGLGMTPIRALGTVDQHSQLQLYLDGPRDKMFTLICGDAAGTGEVVDPGLAADPDLAYLSGRTMGDLLEAEQRATELTLVRRGRPTRVLRIGRLDARVLGALLMHFMAETMIAAKLLAVDPFDQPAVEEGKRLAREFLREAG